MKVVSKLLLNWILIFALVLTGIIMSLGDILCVREDGHAQIENSRIPCCSEEHNHFLEVADTHLQKPVEEDYCKDCLDIPISIVSLIKRSSIKKIFTVHKYHNSITSTLAVMAASDNTDYYRSDRNRIELLYYCSANSLILSAVLLC